MLQLFTQTNFNSCSRSPHLSHGWYWNYIRLSSWRTYCICDMFASCCTLYLVLNDFAISFLDIISIFCKDHSFSFSVLKIKINFFWEIFFFWKKFPLKIWKIFIQTVWHSLAQTFENIWTHFWKPYAISIPMRGGVGGGKRGKILRKKHLKIFSFEKFQF